MSTTAVMASSEPTDEDRRIEEALYKIVGTEEEIDQLRRMIAHLRAQGRPLDEVLDECLPEWRPDWLDRKAEKLTHASLCARALAVIRERGWTPSHDPETYERIAAVGFREKNLTLAIVMYDILAAQHPIGVRGLLYQLVSAGWVESTSDDCYQRVDRIAVKLRESAVVPFAWIVDELRVRLKPSSWSGLADFGQTVREAYRKNFWEHLPVYVEFFVEKQAMAGTLQEVTDEYDVALNPIRGMSSISALHSVAMLWREIEKPIHAYYCGDHDPTGLKIEADAREKLERYSGRSFTWERLAVLPEDFDDLDLLPLQPKRGPNYRPFIDQGYYDCAELDAIPPTILRERVSDAITQHFPAAEWERLRRIEDKEQAQLEAFFAKSKVFT